VQGEIERALTEICAAPIRITGAGRTDTGVHATGQVIDFRTASALDGEAIERGVNALLSKDIAISDVEAASEDFHSRFSATGRTYEYRIRRSRTRDPREWRKEHWLPGSLDVAAMKDASGSLIGRHDFAAFAAGVSGERTVRRAEWSEAGELLRFEIEAEAFLRGMVRGIVERSTADVNVLKQPRGCDRPSRQRSQRECYIADVNALGSGRGEAISHRGNGCNADAISQMSTRCDRPR